jgi:hypothetical protein
MVKLVDMPDLGSGAARRVGSSPIIRTKKASHIEKLFLFLLFTKKSGIFKKRNSPKIKKAVHKVESFSLV